MNELQLIHKGSALVKEDEFTNVAAGMAAYVAHLKSVVDTGGYDADESSINLPSDTAMIESVIELAKAKGTEDLKYIIVVGIGGSNLGTQAVYEALYGHADNLVTSRRPKILFADTVSVSLLRTLKRILSEEVSDKNEVLVNIISKSGSTTETVANFEIIYAELADRFADIGERIVATSGRGSKLWGVAESRGFALLDIPNTVGGRYSVFSAVGLFPLALAGIDIKELLQGACTMRERCLSDDPETNIALTSAVLIYLHHMYSISINNNFFFNPELESVGKWYRQLMGESIGKEKDREGNVVRTGITPIVSVGSTDLHSMAQLYLGGPRDKFTNLVYAPVYKDELAVKAEPVLGELGKDVLGRTAQEIMDAIYGGVRAAYKNNAVAFMETRFDSINASTIGQYLQFKMIEMMMLGEMFGVNPFDQPNVEDYKKETKKILNKGS